MSHCASIYSTPERKQYFIIFNKKDLQLKSQLELSASTTCLQSKCYSFYHSALSFNTDNYDLFVFLFLISFSKYYHFKLFKEAVMSPALRVVFAFKLSEIQVTLQSLQLDYTLQKPGIHYRNSTN